MTTNQLTYQRNAIAANELAEQERANRERERIQLRELAQNKEIADAKLQLEDLIAANKILLADRENIAKYGALQYPSEQEDLWGGPRAWFNNIRRGFEYVLNPVLSILTGGSRK